MFGKTSFTDKRLLLPGRDDPVEISGRHVVLNTRMKPPFPEDSHKIIFGLGCFWGAERLFWQLPGVYTTAAGYAGGSTPNPLYEEVCSGRTNHAEVVLVVYQPNDISLAQLLTVFWEAHDPTQGMKQGNDVGTQYRSAIYTCTEQDFEPVTASRLQYQEKLADAGFPPVTTEIHKNQTFYYAEEVRQQYLAKNPAGYCGLRGTGVRCSS